MATDQSAPPGDPKRPLLCGTCTRHRGSASIHSAKEEPVSSYTGTTDPHQLSVLFVEYFDSGDVDGLVSLYENDAILVVPGGTADDPDARRKTFEQFRAIGAKVRVVNKTLLVRGDVALSHGHLFIEADGQEPLEIRTAEILRRQADGTWKYSIDNALGSAILD
ncbi:nuclear transport factor 2 family protein [Nocardia vinacea]|uniref:YybH family protein n=1 Tax=Nocardia vinacea TaxID=96468 RepID=UPI00343A36C0